MLSARAVVVWLLLQELDLQAQFFDSLVDVFFVNVVLNIQLSSGGWRLNYLGLLLDGLWPPHLLTFVLLDKVVPLQVVLQ